MFSSFNKEIRLIKNWKWFWENKLYNIYDNGERPIPGWDNPRKELGLIVHRDTNSNPTNTKDFDFILPGEVTKSFDSVEDHKEAYNDWNNYSNEQNELFVFDSTLPYYHITFCLSLLLNLKKSW